MGVLLCFWDSFSIALRTALFKRDLARSLGEILNLFTLRPGGALNVPGRNDRIELAFAQNFEK